MSKEYSRREILSMLCAGGASYALGFKPSKPTHDIFIILDDAGGSREDASNIQALLKAGFPTNVAIMPDTPFTSQVVDLVANEDLYALLHQPMEPIKMRERGLRIEESGTDNGIYNTTPVEQVPEILERNFNLIRQDQLENIVGMNNHMGSLVTQNPELMGAVADFLLENDLIFIDSNTYPSSYPGEKAHNVMKTKGVRTGINSTFLDNVQKRDYTLRRLKHMERIAQEKSLIAIGHIAHPSTKDALVEYVQSYEKTRSGELIKDVGPCKLRLRSLRNFRGL